MKFKKLIVILMVFALLAGLTGCAAKSQPTAKTSEKATTVAADQTKDKLFINVEWLKSNLDKVVVLDTRKAEEYQAGHIPGALNAPWQSLANMTGKPGDKGWGTILPASEMAAKLGSLGIDGQKTVITYGTPPGWGEDGRVLWVLNMAGIQNAKMLDGGWKGWQAVKGEESKEVPTPAKVSFTISSLNQDLNVTTDYIKANQSKIKIVDVRSDKEYKGATDFGEARGGHLPGAISLPFENLYNADGMVKSSDELKKLFADAGLSPDDEIVTYCTKGIRSGYMAVVMRNLGYNKAHNYDASFYEWAGDSSLPLEK